MQKNQTYNEFVAKISGTYIDFINKKTYRLT